MRSEEYCLLSDFLYEAIYIPEGIEPPPKSVIECPELQEYIVEFGNRKHDKALVAEIQGNVVGAIWVRIMNDYGHIDNDTPSLAMSVCPQYRGLGIGTSLLKQLLQVERLAGYSKISLSVQKSNYAVNLCGNKRSSKIVMPRQIAMYLCRDIIDTSLKTIGKNLGNRDHTTVMHGIEKIEKELQTNDNLKNSIDTLRKKINPQG